MPLTTISDVVGHSDYALTAGDVHLAQSLRTEAADKIAAWFDAALLGSTPGVSTRVSTQAAERIGSSLCLLTRPRGSVDRAADFYSAGPADTLRRRPDKSRVSGLGRVEDSRPATLPSQTMAHSTAHF